MKRTAFRSTTTTTAGATCLATLGITASALKASQERMRTDPVK